MDQTLESTLAQELLQQLPIGIVMTDSTGQVIWRNATMQSLLTTDIPPDQSTTLMSQAILPFLDAQGTFPLAGAESEDRKWLKHISVELAGGHHAHVYQDVTEAKFFQLERDNLVEQLRAQAPIDPLTGLLTEHALLQGLQPLVSLSRRYDKPLSVALIAVDNLLSAQIEGNPLSADLVLVAISQLLKDQMRWADLIAKMDDDRFLLVLPETTRDAAIKLVEKLEPKLRQLDAPEMSPGQLSLDVRFSVTEWTRTDDAKRLIKRCRADLNSGTGAYATTHAVA